MNTNIASQQPSMDINRKIFSVMVGIGFLCALVIVSIYIYTQPFIERNKTEALEKAIFRIFPEAHNKLTYRMNDHGRFERWTDTSATSQVVYVAYDDNQQLIGIVIKAQGRGYQDTIEFLYGYQPAKQAVTGLVILASRETPGLGSKIATDADFLANFNQLDVTVTADKSALLNAIKVVKPGKKKQAWQVDSITGATISSKAIGKTMQQSASTWIPLIIQNLQDFDIGKTTQRH